MSIKRVLAKVRKADEAYHLINDGDYIAVGLSGGKDSALLLYTLYLYRFLARSTFNKDFKIIKTQFTLVISPVDVHMQVKKAGPACHTGSESCFFNGLYESEDIRPFSLSALMEVIAGRKTSPKEGSYTTYLFEKGRDKILKKVGEECTEVLIGGAKGDKAETTYELGDLIYHAMVLMVEMGISLEDVVRELARRHVIDKKVKQERMQ